MPAAHPVARSCAQSAARSVLARWWGSASAIRIVGDVAGFLATGTGTLRIRIRMLLAPESLTLNEMHYPATNTFFGFRRVAGGGQYVVNDGTTMATVEYDWTAGETVTVVIVGDGDTMQIGVVE